MDRVVTIWTIAIAALWISGAALVLAHTFVEESRVGNLGLYLTCGAAVTTVVRAIQVSHRAQRNAFELGRDAERHGVRRLRG